jgi:archaellum component FlaG (FlaF/FlaG flagellin family)
MVSESINTMIIVIAGIILASMISVALFTQFGVLDSSMRIMVRNAQEKIQTSISISLVSFNTSETGAVYIVIYVKNTGARSISSQELSSTDVYLQDSSRTLFLVYNSVNSLGSWNYIDTDQDNIWSVGETLIVRAYNNTALSLPIKIIIVLPNGVSAEYIFNG